MTNLQLSNHFQQSHSRARTKLTRLQWQGKEVRDGAGAPNGHHGGSFLVRLMIFSQAILYVIDLTLMRNSEIRRFLSIVAWNSLLFQWRIHEEVMGVIGRPYTMYIFTGG
jgi:hypothetical protein